MHTHPHPTIETSGSIVLAPRTDDALKPQAAPAEPLRRPRTPERTGTFHFHFSVLIFKIYLYVKFFSLSLYLILFQYISLNLNISHFILSYLIPQQYLIFFTFLLISSPGALKEKNRLPTAQDAGGQRGQSLKNIGGGKKGTKEGQSRRRGWL